MEQSKDMLYEEWQQSVREYVRMVRAEKIRGISQEDLEHLSAPYIQRIDSAYSKFKRFQQDRRDFCPEACY